MREFSTGATRDNDETKNDYEGFMSPHATKLFGDYMTKHRKQADGKLRDSDNWQKGIPREAYMKSGWRHWLEIWTLHREYLDKRTLDADAAEQEFLPEFVEALCAMKFNIDGYLHEYAIGRDAGIEREEEKEEPKLREHRFDYLGVSDGGLFCGGSRFHPVEAGCLRDDGSESTTSANEYRDAQPLAEVVLKWQHKCGGSGQWVDAAICPGTWDPAVDGAFMRANPKDFRQVAA